MLTFSVCEGAHTATSKRDSRKSKEGRVPQGPGDSVLELDSDTALVVNKEAARLSLCRCSAWKWRCEEHDTGTYCFKECIAYQCVEVPDAVLDIVSGILSVLSRDQPQQQQQR
jgi:hypothetical protein